MRASEEQDIVLPTLRFAFATVSRVADFRMAAASRLPQGWSLTDIDPYDDTASLLVSRDSSPDAPGFLVSEGAGKLELHAVVDDELVLLGCRRAGEHPYRMPVLPAARAA